MKYILLWDKDSKGKRSMKGRENKSLTLCEKARHLSLQTISPKDIFLYQTAKYFSLYRLVSTENVIH